MSVCPHSCISVTDNMEYIADFLLIQYENQDNDEEMPLFILHVQSSETSTLLSFKVPKL